MMQNNEEYLRFWEERYAKHQYEWGQKPSILAVKAVESIPKGGTVLDVACGYGRDAIFLARSGYRAYGMDFSEFAIKRARDWAQRENLQIDFRQKELTNCGYSENFFDGVVMFNTLHLLWEPKRMGLVSEIHRILKPGGTGLFTFFSTKEKGFGIGKEVEKNSFSRGNTRMRHYFTTKDIRDLFSAYSSLSAKEFYLTPEEHEHHGREKHGHHEWLVIVTK
jgi:SAM-dependent methyltransferase